MKVHIKRPDGHALSVEGRVTEVRSLVNTWWSGAEGSRRVQRTMGFQMEEKDDDRDSA